MEGASKSIYTSINNEEERTAKEYVSALKGVGRISGLVLYVYPFLLLFIEALFINNPYVLAGLFILYWLAFYYVIRKRYDVDIQKRDVTADFRDYLFHSPFSQYYFKFSILAMIVFFGTLAGVYVHMTTYEGVALIVGIICLISVTIYFNPWLSREVKNSTPLESENINNRLLEITQNEGMVPITPRVIKGDKYKVSNAYCAGIIRPVICITDYALKNMSDDEVVSVLAHEVSHLKRRDTLKMILPAASAAVAISVMVGVVAFWSTQPAMIPFLQRVMPEMIQAWVLIAFGGLFAGPGIMRYRGENNADMFSVKYFGSERTINSLAKMQHLNRVPVFTLTMKRSSLLLRIEKIRKYEN